jgi:hypothetical protein
MNHLAAHVAAAIQSAATAPTLQQAAHRFAVASIPVFPCVPGAKQPLTRKGFYDATTDWTQIDRWWTHTPEANIGIPTGAISGLAVLDVDVHPTGDGYAAIGNLRSQGLVDGWAWLVRTPSGGLHAYYPASDTEQRNWAAPKAHIDFRGEGGYIIAPPSRVTRENGPVAYQLLELAQSDVQPLDADRIHQILAPPPPLPRPEPAQRDTPEADPSRLAAWVATRPEGERNRTLHWAACRMAEDGHRYSLAMTVLGEAAQMAGLPEGEARATIRSAYRTAAPRAPARLVAATNPTTTPAAIPAL